MGKLAEIGVSGLRIFSGYLDEEYLPELRGDRGRKTFRQMSDNDPTIGAILNAISLLIRAVKWTAEPAQSGDGEVGDNFSAQAEAEAEFVESLFQDMSHTWEDFIAEVLSMLTFGWAYHEIVLKRRVGPDTNDPETRSNFTDGRIGVRKLAIRAQETIQRWEVEQDGGIQGMWQLPPQGGGIVFIPIERALLFKTVSRKNNPEGVSALRNAYRPWKFLERIQEYEAIGIERELAGLPLVRIPARYFTSTDPGDQAFLANMTKVARDLKFNAQGGLLIASDLYSDAEGSPIANAPLVTVELIKSAGTRTIETVPVKQAYQADIARSVLADFIMLGAASKGAYNLAESKTNLFYKACGAFLGQIAGVLNRHLLPRIWDANGLDRSLMPEMKPGRLMPLDTASIGTLIQQLAAAGAPLFPNTDLLNYVLDEASLPEVSDEALAEQETAQQQQLEAKAQQQQALMDGGKGGGDAALGKAAPMPLYVNRPVINAADIIAWAKSQGFTSTLTPDDMHATICYSHAPVDAAKTPDHPSTVAVVGGQRAVKPLGDKGAVALAFDSDELGAQHKAYRAAGASHDYLAYQPHVTICYSGAPSDLSSVEPYKGPIVFGPEVKAPLDEDWSPKEAA